MRTSGRRKSPIRERKGIFGIQNARVHADFTAGIIDKSLYLPRDSFAFFFFFYSISFMDIELFRQHHFDLSPHEIIQFERYLTLFLEYNNHTNLSAIRDEKGIIEKHFIDSLYGVGVIDGLYSRHSDEGRIQVSEHRSFVPEDDGTLKLLDIWSGWWFPGIPLKIVIPELQVTLLDSVGKKVKAMDHFVRKLDLENISAIQERAEILAKNPEHRGCYDIVVSRATAYITDILPWALPFLTPKGKVLLYKMPSKEEERDRIQVMKKLSLTLEGELEYTLSGKERMIQVYSRIL
jgi:16S rRNA (guanine527-N7)-methyltransferase